jgi:hypothetical protein
MRVTENQVPPLPLDVGSLRRAPRTPAPTDDAPFGAVIGVLIGAVVGVVLWALLAAAVVWLSG